MKPYIPVKLIVFVIGCLILNVLTPITAGSPAFAAPAAQEQPETPAPDVPAAIEPAFDAPLDPAVTPVRRVNAPFFATQVRLIDSAIFWFGRVTASENYADVRVGYTATDLVIRVNIVDRLLWHHDSPTAADLTQYDAVSLFLSLDGNTGTALDNRDYRFVAMSSSGAGKPAAQAAYRGNGASWGAAAVAFTANSGWRGDARNNTVPDRGWSQEYIIPFASLGLGGAPANNTVWGLAVSVHDRDSAAGPPLAAQIWPETLNNAQPSSWGQLAFGLPVYNPPALTPTGGATVRQGLNGALVPDAAVGGTVDNLCPGNENYIWSGWGNANFGEAPRFNLQNQADIADWPCFAKYYVTFPLNQVPAGKTILSATLTMHQWGGSNQNLAQRSLIQIFTIAEEWSENSLTWNNAPMAVENVSRAYADVVSTCSWPCVPRTWDVSRAVAQADNAGGASVRLAMYEADAAYHSGKYFIASEEPDWNAVARPTLTIVWGDRAAQLNMSATPSAPKTGDSVQVRFQFTGTGEALTLSNPFPGGLGAPSGLSASHGSIQYSASARTVTWSGSPASGQNVTLSFSVPVVAQGVQALTNTASLTGSSGSSQAGVTLIVNGETIALPLVTR